MKIIRLALLVVVLVGCGASEGDAKQSLEQDGYTDVKITGKSGDAFQFSAKDKKGASCTGTVTIKKGFGSTSSEKVASCTSS